MKRIAHALLMTLLLGALASESVAGPTEFFPIEPCRRRDTRNMSPPNPLSGWEQQTVRVRTAGGCGVPSDAKAVAITLTALAHEPADALPNGGIMMIYDAAATYEMGEISNLNFHGGVSEIANSAIVPLSSSHFVRVVGGYATDKSADYLLDVVGYFR